VTEETERVEFQYFNGVLLGNRFWTFGGHERSVGNNYNEQQIQSIQTTIWSTEKQVWIKGPKLITKSNGIDTNMYNYKSMEYDLSFSSVINSSTIIMIGGDTVVCFDIAANKWTDYPDFPLDTHPQFNEMVTPEIAMTVTIDKNRKRYLFTEKIGSLHLLK
jgi:hypothetical protein